MPEQGKTLNHRYRLDEPLGEGGMAKVFRAEDLRMKRDVAVKILRPQYTSDDKFRQRFINEAHSIANFSHANVVTVYDVREDGPPYYIVMEYVDGEDLRQRLEREKRLAVNEALNIAFQMAKGLGYAHRKGLVHRDIKPGNILITPNDEVKIADFGIAKAIAGDMPALTEPGVVWGTTAYLSPEQIRGGQATPASDVYAMGIVLYEMLAGHPPFQGEDRVAIALQHLDSPPPPFEEALQIPPRVERLVRQALEKNSASRLRDANQLALALRRFVEPVETTTARSSISPAPTAAPGELEARRPPRHREREDGRSSPPSGAESTSRGDSIWVTLLLGVVALIAVGGLIYLFSSFL